MAKWKFTLDLVTPCVRVGKIPVELWCFALKLTGEKICVVVKLILPIFSPYLASKHLISNNNLVIRTYQVHCDSPNINILSQYMDIWPSIIDIYP